MSAERQLGLDGREIELERLVAHRPLTERQREVLRFVRIHGDTRPVEVGRMMHSGRKHSIGHVFAAYGAEGGPRACCRYASSDGFDALRRLERRGLVYRVRRGHWRAVVTAEDWPT